MSKFPIPAEALKRHTAILGMTGSGKSSTGRTIVEHVVEEDHRVCILDTIKSDWWGITSSRDGKKPGLPFKILGGPHGHLGLRSADGKTIGQLVGNGKLPLSIIDMSDFEAGGLQKFFNEFVPALMKNMKGVLYLFIEEAHEVAPKERAGFGAENMTIHFAKKLGTAGRSKGIRLIVATQRVQALHNAVLGSCETVIAHRIGFADDQVPVLKWMQAKIGKDNTKIVEAELANLPDGVAFIASGAPVKVFERAKMPLFKTYDNTKTPDGAAADLNIKTAPVDLTALKVIIGEAAIEADANDPKKLQEANKKLAAEKAALQKQLDNVKVRPAAAAPTIDQKAIDAALKKAHQEGQDYAFGLCQESFNAVRSVVEDAYGLAQGLSQKLKPATTFKFTPAKGEKYTPPVIPQSASPKGIQAPAKAPIMRSERPAPEARGDGTLTGPEQKIMNSLATWKAMGHGSPSNAQVAWLAGYSPNSTSYTNPRGALKSKGMLVYPAPDYVSAMADGEALSTEMDVGDSLLAYVVSQLPGPEQKILLAAAKYEGGATNDEIATEAGYSALSTSYTNPRGSLRSKELIFYPEPGKVELAAWLK